MSTLFTPHIASAAQIVVTASASAHPISTFQAIVLGLLQGVTELFPVSSLGHTVLFPTLFGWNTLVESQSSPESFWLAFVVMLHVGSALGLLAYFWRDWVGDHARVLRNAAQPPNRDAGRATGVADRDGKHPNRVARPGARASDPRGAGKAGDGSDLPDAQRRDPAGRRALRRRSEVRALALAEGAKADGGRRLDTLAYREAVVVGLGQSTALIAGISRDGMCMTVGLARGLDNEDAARYAFLLATPIILAAGIFKFSDLTGPLGNGVRGQAIIAALCAAVAGYSRSRSSCGTSRHAT